MSLPTIFGPDGQPLEPSALDAGRGRVITHREAVELVAAGRAMTPEQWIDKQRRIEPSSDDVVVGKRGDDRRGVRSQGVAVTSIWDRNRGKPKPTPLTPETLRLMAMRSEWVRAIIKTRKNQIGSREWSIIPKDKDDKSGSTQTLVDRLTRLFKRPQMLGSRPTSMSWRHFVGAILEDILVLDAGSIEKERTMGATICAMYPVDGATIRPNIDDKGGHYDDAYVQVVEGVVTARFGMEELIYIVDNPSTDVRFCGYGLSPLENLVISVTADLHASKYNSSYFEKGAVPEGLLNLGEDVAPEDVDAFRLYWMNEIMGKPWAIPIMGGKNVEWLQWRDNNRDMQFMEYQNWILKKMCAVFQITPQEIGILEDVNRSTADSQEGTNESKSIEPILSLLKDVFDVEVIGEHGEGVGDWVEFDWTEEGESAEEINAKFQPMVQEGAAQRSEWREAQGLETADDGTPGAEGLEMFLVTGEVKPLPTKEDAELLSVANQQKREDEQAQKQQEEGGPAADMPWKPGDHGDPALQEAQRKHDEESGIGPRNNPPPAIPAGGDGPQDEPPVGKVSPHGRDTHPAATAREDELVAILRTRQEQLVDDLAEILELPPSALAEAVGV